MKSVFNIAIQGIKGSFHHSVAENYFDNPQCFEECMTFDVLVDSLINGKTEAAVMALENSIAGSIIPNYALIDVNDLKIVGEYYLDIQHHLMALPNQSIEEIKEVHSHPMALLQCKEFFKSYPEIKLVEAKDTADVAKQISERQSPLTSDVIFKKRIPNAGLYRRDDECRYPAEPTDSQQIRNF